MNDSEILKPLPRAAAPDDFENRVLAALKARLQQEPARRRARTFRWATAGTAAGVLALFVGLNLFVLRGTDGPALSAARSSQAAITGTVHLNEPISYRHEVRTASYEPGTVYILEQVSDASNTLYKY
jgi:hypothetical protein